MKAKIIILIFISLFFLSCGSINNKVKIIDINQIEFYCWCFQYGDSIRNHRICTTGIGVNSNDLINKTSLFYILSDSSRIKRMNLILNKYSEINNLGYDFVDARFVILLNGKKRSDTLTYYDNNTFCINNSKLLEYNFNIMDSLCGIIGINTINCE